MLDFEWLSYVASLASQMRAEGDLSPAFPAVVLAECRGVGSHLIRRSRDGLEVRSREFLSEVPWSGPIVICPWSLIDTRKSNPSSCENYSQR